MIRTLLFALSLVAANSVVALAQDDDQAPPPRRPAVHHTIPHSVKMAAVQAPFPTPKPAVAEPGTPKASAPKVMTQTQAQENPAAILQAFAIGDLQNALADANGQTPPDTVAAACWQELINVVQSPAISLLPNQLGAFSAFQKARDLQNLVSALQSNSGPLTALKVACAPVILDTQTFLMRLGVIGGTVAATGGLIP